MLVLVTSNHFLNFLGPVIDHCSLEKFHCYWKRDSNLIIWDIFIFSVNLLLFDYHNCTQKASVSIKDQYLSPSV